VLATLSCFGLVFALVWKETRALVPALTAVGMFAGSYALSGGWFDLARVDTTCLAFCLGAWYVVRFGRGRSGTVLASVLFALAFMTKQAALAVLPGLVLATGLVHGFRRSLWFLPALAAIVGVMVTLEVSSDGWYSFFTFRVPSGFENVADMVVDFWKKEIFAEYSMALVLGLYFALSARDRIEWTAALKVHVPLIMSMVGMTYIVRMHAGSYLNDKMTAHAPLAVAAGLGLARLLQIEQPGARDRMWIYGSLVALSQLLFLVYPPAHWVPTSADYAEGRKLIATMKQYPGDVLTTHHGALTRQAGKAAFAQGMAVFDVVRTAHDHRDAQRKLRDSFEKALASHRFSAVVTDDGLVMPELIERYYERSTTQIVHDGRALLPRTGNGCRPRIVYVPRQR
jgi:hypothetical protein